MIVKIGKGGKSFKGLSDYLTHDPKARSEDRVDWTHTHNLANDHVPSAVDEMLWTARNAELLKQEAGVRAGGRVTESPVKEVSLNWSPEDKPTKEHMIETAEGFLRHMNWHEHQTLMVAHNDKHAHVHLMINVIHPETGLHLDDGLERRRAQAWALEYERENGRIYCEQRLKNVEEREDAPTRPAWLAFQKREEEFERDEKSMRLQEDILINEKIDPKIANFEEWKKLKQLQKDERLEFFADGKSQFSDLRKSVYREVREEFRERWSDIYENQRNGADITELKAELVAEQKAVLEERRDEACKELRETRDGLYRDLLDDQRDIRLGLRSRQEAGLDNSLFLQQVEEGIASKDLAVAFRETANEVTAREEERGQETTSTPFSSRPERDSSGMKSGAAMGTSVGEGIGLGLTSLMEGLVDGLIWSKPDPKPRRQEPEPANENHFAAAADEARNQQNRDKQDAERDDWYRKQRSLSGE
jgi:relaxase-like protein